MKHVRRETAELLLILTKKKAIAYIKKGKPRMQEREGKAEGRERRREEEKRRERERVSGKIMGCGSMAKCACYKHL